ncbi:MAG: TolC family protein, partial [Pseudomonadota bacterium]|nr:TolC family protein [Pseudomonadota bacterium]
MKSHGLVITAVMTLSACSVGPDYKAPSVTASPHYDVQAEQHVSFSQKVSVDWWSTFHSGTLDSVMRRAIAGNLELTAADATLRQAAASVAAAEGALFPQVDFAAQAGRQRVHNAARPVVTNFYGVGPQVSFDLDVFGGNQRRVEQQQALADFQQHRFEAAYLTLTGDVASQALLMASASAQMEAVQTLLATDAKNLELVRAAQHSGTTTQLDVSLAETRLAQDRT